MKLNGQIVLVTGASRGIGAEIARACAAEGAAVIVNYKSRAEAAEQVVEQIRRKGGTAIPYPCDVTREDQVREMAEAIVESFGRIDVLVNNALSHYTFNPRVRRPAWELDWSHYSTQLEGSLQGAFHTISAVMPHMQSQASGRVINMVTNLIDFPVIPYHDYTTAKAALLGYTRGLAKELGGFGITVNAVAPGLTASTDSSRDTPESVREQIRALTPLGRLADPSDIAGAVLFLASDWGKFLTGQCLRVDGGLVMS
ncbi:3-oxoacyl-ACP reductase [Paenibacillus sp. JX-17]|uniref:3-oxoacyl-ACP reductase n=1 Tax=Paenibacillus lacisoli TaxID=3064525 RepID=A0ABT9CB29_9BACL|nr:3-oxoacyl-ACP reductase [Paenibacillus sp. JX-17]MDO7906471.1 3-oxoacyl-ACP reductase [Paenibacillus sp. JX-17]